MAEQVLLRYINYIIEKIFWGLFWILFLRIHYMVMKELLNNNHNMLYCMHYTNNKQTTSPVIDYVFCFCTLFV